MPKVLWVHFTLIVVERRTQQYYSIWRRREINRIWTRKSSESYYHYPRRRRVMTRNQLSPRDSPPDPLMTSMGCWEHTRTRNIHWSRLTLVYWTWLRGYCYNTNAQRQNPMINASNNHLCISCSYFYYKIDGKNMIIKIIYFTVSR